MPTWAVAVLGAVIGATAAWAFAVGDRFFCARREVAENDRAVADHDEDLASWVSDRHLRLRRDVGRLASELNARGLFHSGELGYQLALAKETALHEYRDELRRVERAVAARREAEGRFHRVWRRLLGRSFQSPTASERAQPVLDTWREAVTRHGHPAHEVVDPARRDLDDALADVRQHGSAGYV